MEAGTKQLEEVAVGEARKLMERVTQAVLDKDFDRAAACYAEQAVLVTPDKGHVTGREAIRDYFAHQADGFPDGGWESLAQHEAGEVAVDEGYFTGTHTEPLPLPSGELLPASGNSIRVRACDVAVVAGGSITEHRFYFDQMELLGQLGLLPGEPA